MKSLRSLLLTASSAALLGLTMLLQAKPVRAQQACAEYCQTHKCLTGCYSIDGIHWYTVNTSTSYCKALENGLCELKCYYDVPC